MRLLYATDGGTAAVDAGRLIMAMGRREGTHVTVASVVVTGLPQLRHLSAALRSDETRRRLAHDAVKDARQTLDAAGFATDGVVREGRPAVTLTELAEERNADLVVAGSGVRWIGGRVLGSVSTDLLYCAPMSVLIVHEPPRTASTTVVCGTDGSKQSLAALDTAGAFLDPRRCTIVVVSAAELLAPMLSPPYIGHATSAPSPEVEAEVMQPARDSADLAVRRLTAQGFQARAHAVMGHPLKRLLSEIDHLGADLAVVGSRGLDALDRASLGSVSDQIVRHAPATLVGR